MSFFKAFSNVLTDITAKGARYAMHGVAEVAGIFDENKKKEIHHAALDAEKQIRRNPLIDAINEINNNERELTKRLIRYIDMKHDNENPIETWDEFTQRVSNTNLWKWATLSWLPYEIHKTIRERKEEDIIDIIDITDIIKNESDKNQDIDQESLLEILSTFEFKSITKNYYVAVRDKICLIGFCGTVTSDFEHLCSDVNVGNLVAGYHYKMADLACEYYDIVLKDHIKNSSEIQITGHSLGGGIAIYLNLLLYMLQESGEISGDIIINNYCFGVPCVLPRVFKNRISHRMINVIDHNDPIPKYYKNENIAHANHLVYVDGNDPTYRHHSMFYINPSRFNPLNQFEKFKYDADMIDFHYMKNYLSICRCKDVKICEKSNCYKY